MARKYPSTRRPRTGGRTVGHVVDVQVGKKVRQRRTLMGLTQKELAAAVGITFQQVQKYEGGSNRISVSRLYEFCHVLGVPISFFFYGLGLPTDTPGKDGPASSPSGVGDLSTRREALELIRIYNRISDPAIRGKVRSLVKDIADSIAK